MSLSDVSNFLDFFAKTLDKRELEQKKVKIILKTSLLLVPGETSPFMIRDVIEGKVLRLVSAPEGIVLNDAVEYLETIRTQEGGSVMISGQSITIGQKSTSLKTNQRELPKFIQFVNSIERIEYVA